MNVLKAKKRNDVFVLVRTGFSFREIEKRLGVGRDTVARYAREAGVLEGNSKAATGEGVATGIFVENSPVDGGISPPGSSALVTVKIPKLALSACDPYREWIEKQVLLGRNAVAIYQDRRRSECDGDSRREAPGLG